MKITKAALKQIIREEIGKVTLTEEKKLAPINADKLKKMLDTAVETYVLSKSEATKTFKILSNLDAVVNKAFADGDARAWNTIERIRHTIRFKKPVTREYKLKTFFEDLDQFMWNFDDATDEADISYVLGNWAALKKHIESFNRAKLNDY